MSKQNRVSPAMNRFFKYSLYLLSAALLVLPGCFSSPQKSGPEAAAEISSALKVPPIMADGDTLTGFTTTTGAWATHKTVVTTAFDKEKLSLRFVCFLENGKQPVFGGKTKDDMGIFSGEHVEIFLCTEPGTGKYYQLALNPEGVMYSAIGMDTSWELENAKVKTAIESDRWTLDIAIPFKSLGLASAPEKGAVWKVNFCRSSKTARGSEHSNLAGLVSYHNPAMFREMVFDKKGTRSRILLEDFSCTAGKITAIFSFEQINEPVTIEIRKGDFVHRTSNLPRSGSIEIKADLPPSYIPLKEAEYVYVSAKNSITHKNIFFTKFNLQDENRDMILPDKFYYTAGQDNEIAFRLTGTGKDSRIPMTVTLSGRDGNILRKGMFTDKGSFSTSGLGEGAYILAANSAGERTERLLFIRSAKDLAGVPLKKGARLALKDGAITSGGEFVYLIGSSSTGKPLPSGKFFNLSTGNFGVMPFSVRIGGIPGRRLVRKPKTAYTYAAKEKFYAVVEKQLAKADPASAILHRFTYEAQIPTFLPGTGGRQYDEVDSGEFHRDLYRHFKRKFPDLIFCLQTDAPARIKEFVPACDLMEVCPSGGYSDAAIEKLKYGVPQAVKSLNGKPVIFWMGVTIPNNSCRKAEELRAAIYLHIIHGGSGTIMHMGHGRLPFERSRLWSVIRGINGEISAFYPQYRAMPLMDAKILGIQAEKEYAVSIRGNGREAIALVVSLTGGKNRVMLNPADGWKIVSGGKAGKPENWTPYEARVFRLKK